MNAGGRASRAPLPPAITLPKTSKVSDNLVITLIGIPTPATAVGTGMLFIILTVMFKVVINFLALLVVVLSVFKMVNTCDNEFDIWFFCFIILNSSFLGGQESLNLSIMSSIAISNFDVDFITLVILLTIILDKKPLII